MGGLPVCVPCECIGSPAQAGPAAHKSTIVLWDAYDVTQGFRRSAARPENWRRVGSSEEPVTSLSPHPLYIPHFSERLVNPPRRTRGLPRPSFVPLPSKPQYHSISPQTPVRQGTQNTHQTLEQHHCGPNTRHTVRCPAYSDQDMNHLMRVLRPLRLPSLEHRCTVIFRLPR
jgi:hypothetical protein